MSGDRGQAQRAGDGAGERPDRRFAGRLRGYARGDNPHQGLRDAIAFLNRESVSLPQPEAPPWEGRATGYARSDEPPLAPVRELRPGERGGLYGGGGTGSPSLQPHPMQPVPPPQVQQAQAHAQAQAQAAQAQAQQAQMQQTQMQNGPQFTMPPAGGAAHPPVRRRGTADLARHDVARSFGGPGGHTGPDPSGGGNTGINAFADIDWSAVELIRKQVRDRITEQFPHRDAGTEQQRRAFGMAVIEEAVNSWYARAISRGLNTSEAHQNAMRRAVGASVFGMGRLTPMLDHPDIENIEYRGCDDGYVVYSDGRVEKAPAIADSDDALLNDLQYWAAKQNRALSTNSPHLYLTLEGGARLTATVGTSKRPNVVIRRHRVVDVTLDDLVARGMLSPAIAAFLRAAVLANCNIVVTGPLNSGKTTLLRALAAEIPPMERYATLETEYELHLDEVGRHPRMVAYQALVGTAEAGHNGRRAGEVTLTDIIEVALRMNFTRLIVGEIRGAEVVAMLEAVSTGGRGSICTMHANSARDVFNRFVTLCTRTNMTRDSAVQLAAESLHYIVNVQMDADSAAGVQNTRTARRYVDQIVEVNGLGDGIVAASTDVFAPGPDGRAVFAHRPERMARLQKSGFDPNWLLYGNDQWSIAGAAVAQQQHAAQNVSRPAQHTTMTFPPAYQNMTPVPHPGAGSVRQAAEQRRTATQSADDPDAFDQQYLAGRRRLDRTADFAGFDDQGGYRRDEPPQAGGSHAHRR